MNITDISTNVQALLENTDDFVTILAHPPKDDTDFAGFPAVCHYYSTAESNFATVSQNRRVYEYVVELYLQTDASTTPTTEYREAYALTDATMQMFDETIDLSSTALGLTRACDIMRPTPSELLPVQTNQGVALQMRLRLYCEADVSFR